MKKIQIILIALIFLLPLQGNSQRKRNKQNDASKTEKVSLNAFKLRNVGPAFLSGRIADIAIHPDNENVWYIAVGSGGVWMTDNAGNTWNPIFDSQPTYSIGSVDIDPSNPSIIWLDLEKTLVEDMLGMVMVFIKVQMEERHGKIWD